MRQDTYTPVEILMIGSVVSHYKILEHLGGGGMGVVYKAQDLKLDRPVALKFLSPELTQDPDAKQRFIYEAKAASSLDHPNICTIHDIEETGDGRLFIAMACYDGETVRKKIEKGPLPVDHAVDIAMHVAGGLSRAHEAGIVHRDVKPGNIMVTARGELKILDFGLAKLSGRALTTRSGMTLGTVAYMSPEQARSEAVDHRTDIWSTGVVLYEMLTGQLPFKSPNELALLYAILKKEPPAVRELRPEVPEKLEKVIARAMAKRADERYQREEDLLADLRETSFWMRTSSVTLVQRLHENRTLLKLKKQFDIRPLVRFLKTRAFAWTVAGLLGAALALSASYEFTVARVPVFSAEAQIAMPENIVPEQYPAGGNFALSFDGSRLAFVGRDSNGASAIWIRPLNSGKSSMLAGTQGASYPVFWSPDGRSIGFFQAGVLMRINLSGGAPLRIADAPESRGGSWGKNDTIIFCPDQVGAVYKVSANGGIPQAVTSIDTAYPESHRWPSFLPDGRRFLFFHRPKGILGTPIMDSIYVASLDGGRSRALVQANSDAMFAGEYLLFMRGSEIMAQRLDVDRLEAVGEPSLVAEDVGYSARFNKSLFTVSRTGILVYQEQAPRGFEANFYSIDRTFTRRQPLGMYDYYVAARYSPDREKIALDIVDLTTRNVDIWTINLPTGILTRLTFDPGEDSRPIWSPDGKRIAFARATGNRTHVLVRNADGSGEEELLWESDKKMRPSDWSPDGNFILCDDNIDLLSIPLRGNQKPFLIEKVRASAGGGRVSPDGKWISFWSTGPERSEVFVRAFPGEGRIWQITSEGGTTPRWLPGGKELYYTNNGVVMSARLEFGGASVKVLGTRRVGAFASSIWVELLDLSATGGDILAGFRVEPTGGRPFTVVVNWTERVRH
jgi:eukaryotic-like serine/threonine-protein kinase